jgi:hypothetical protein
MNGRGKAVNLIKKKLCQRESFEKTSIDTLSLKKNESNF